MKKKINKIIAVFLAVNILVDAILPTAAFALTGGPSQPEVQGFTPVGTSDMVNLFSGDFNYNIPLMDVGGYPLNISYQTGVTMDQEASWVGLGWSLNPGVINRNMRSLPDDFKGDLVKKEFNIKANQTYSLKISPDVELFGVAAKKLAEKFKLKMKAGFSLALSLNTYNGYGFTGGLDFKLSAMKPNNLNTTGHLGITAGSESGVGINPSLSFDRHVEDKINADNIVTGKVGLGFNSRAGLTALTLSSSRQKTSNYQDINAGADKDYDGNESKKHTAGNGGSSISFANQTFTPTSGHSMLNLNLSLSGKLGGAFWGAIENAHFEGAYSGQFLLHHAQEFPAYGYFNSYEGSVSDEKVLMDFNREKDGGFTEHTPALPLTNFTYDIYSVSGQGIGGMYRPKRSDIGVMFDHKVTSVSAGAGVSLPEAAVGNLMHVGQDVSLNESNSHSGKWEHDNAAAQLLAFKDKSATDPLYEPYYFKQAGEKTAENDPDFINSIGGLDPVYINIDKEIEDAPAQASFTRVNSSVAIPSTGRSKRERRNEVISLMSAEEATTYGEIINIENYPLNDFSTAPQIIARNTPNGNRQSHHTSQITSYRSDGAKYVYGIAAYNNTQIEKSFAIQTCIQSPVYTPLHPPDMVTGLVDYDPSDATKENKSGMDHYFDKTTMPAYAHSYLLTEVLSADYVDVTGNGPTEDDLGTYTKINYTKLISDYKWRVPFNKANYNEGLKSIVGDEKGDDKANYIYGEKEIWYVHSIETKNYVAQFTMDNRMDGLGVASENGGKNASLPLKKLNKITLYSKPDWKKNTINATPIKTVNFVYDYSLCKGIDNANSTDLSVGKLTLKKVYFTYGNSQKGKLSPYEFLYADMNHDGIEDANPKYNLKGYDRWGNFKPNDIPPPNTPPMTTSEFPYVEQSANADVYAAAWQMTSVKLPSGGEINVNYEADDYAYVQNKRAMQMFTVTGAGTKGSDATNLTGDRLYITDLDNPSDIIGPRNYIYFKLQTPVPLGTDIGALYFKEKDGTPITDFYCKFLVDLGRHSSQGQFEYIPAYVSIEYDRLPDSPPFGLVESSKNNLGLYTQGYVQLKLVETGDKMSHGPNINPITKAAWNFTKLYLPRLATAQPEPTDNGIIQILTSIGTAAKSILTMFEGVYYSMKVDRMGQYFTPEKSFFRLYNPNNAKKGGGSRVQSLVLSDSWSSMTGITANTTSNYGQQYDYTTTDEYNNVISSGVAAYEPMLGGDENPFKQPVFFEEKHKMVPSDDFYQEKPYGESFFPGASVGYSKVTVKNIKPTNINIVKNGTGKVVNEFYTAKDFPTKTNQTDLLPVRHRPNPILQLLKVHVRDYMTASQGFVVEVNDMHGKPKATWVYQEAQTSPISGVEYIYKGSQKPIALRGLDTVITKINVNGLDNTILCMEKNGSISKKSVGVDIDFITDMREQETTNRTGGINGNLDAFLVAFFPSIVPVILPAYSKEKVRFRSAVTTKVINRSGILEQTIAHDLGATVSTKNMMLDAETGEVLLTQTINQFDDNLYSLSYPAHWAYDRMGPAYKNMNVEVSPDLIASSPEKYFANGDEVQVYVKSDNGKAFESKAWITQVKPLKAININGLAVDLTGKTLKVIRSGRRNQQSVPVGTVTSLYSPLNAPQTGLEISATKGILNASSVEYDEVWQLFCECGYAPGTAYNPYVKGTLGNWRLIKSYLYLTERSQTRANDNTNIRKDGVYTAFSPFWTVGAPAATPSDWTKNSDKWQYTSQVTIYSPYGPELENQDALGRYSSAIYGYNNTMPTAVSANAKYTDIAYDGFEDYNFAGCSDDHFSYKSPVNTAILNQGRSGVSSPLPFGIDDTQSHSGRRSIKVAPNQSATVKKVLTNCAEVAKPGRCD